MGGFCNQLKRPAGRFEAVGTGNTRLSQRLRKEIVVFRAQRGHLFPGLPLIWSERLFEPYEIDIDLGSFTELHLLLE